MHKLTLTAILSVVLFGATFAQTDSYPRAVQQWRAAHEKQLRSDDDWLSLVGLFWLKPGVNTVGAGNKYDIALTNSFTAGKFGEIVLSHHGAVLTLEHGVRALSAGAKISTLTGEQILEPVALEPDDPGPATQIRVGTQTFYVIKRDGKFGIRLKDSLSPSRINFKGEKWYPVDSRYRVTADYEPYPEPRPVKVPNVLGGDFDYKAPGLLHFKLEGKDYTLMPVIEGDHLFIIFRDLTSRSETYGAGRFLYAPVAKDGKVILDFNKAENPPCAFTDFATCPLPPQQNRLDLAIPAGEKRNH